MQKLQATVSLFPQLREVDIAKVDDRIDTTDDPAVRVLIVDDCRLSSECLTAQLAEQHVSAVCASDLESLLSQTGRTDWDVVLVSVNAQDSDTLLHVSLDLKPSVRVIVFGLAENKQSEIVACAESGVSGIHLNSESFEHLLELIHDRAKPGKAACSTTVSAILLKNDYAIARSENPALEAPLLSPREKQILELLEAGLSNQQIATRLSVTIHTVKNHVHKVLTKLGVSTRAEAVASNRARRYEPS